MSGTICGREYMVREPLILARTNYHGRGGVQCTKPKVRILVDGINHPKGQQIRFKSVKRAENHIKNFGLELAT